MTAMTYAARPAPMARPMRRLSDEEIVALAAAVLGDPRAWAVSDAADLGADQWRDASRRIMRLLRDALATV